MADRSTTTHDPLAAAAVAMRGAQWDEAARLYEQATAADGSAEAWAGLSRAAWWLGDHERTMAARERAYRLFQAAGDHRRAAHMALWLGGDHLDFHGDDALARAWLRRSRSLLEGESACAEQGWVRVMEADVLVNADGDAATAATLSEEALQIARDVGDVDLEVVALSMLGGANVAMGEAERGLRQLEESMALAVGAEFVDAAAPGWALCHNVIACTEVGDFSQAARWCEALQRFAESWRARHFFGSCRLAYGGVLTTHGHWSAAEEELVSARDNFLASRPAMAAPSAVRLGQLRVRQGRLEEARGLFEEAVPMPAAMIALGELDLATGDAVGAAEAADRVLRHVADDNLLERLPALELAARARAAAGEHDEASAAATEVSALAARLGTPYLRGRACAVAAETALRAGNWERARTSGEDAADLFTRASAPFEKAMAQLVLAQALHGLGRADAGDAVERAAQDALVLLGARPSADSATDPATDPAAGPAAGPARNEELSARERDVLRLVASGQRDAAIAEQLFLSPHTVHRHVANIRTKLDVGSRAAAVAEATRRGLL